MPAVRSNVAATADIRNQPAYSLAEGARYLKLPPATLRSWVLGRRYPTRGGDRQFRALIRPALLRPPTLSFWNLIEAHVLRSLRTDHGVSVTKLRQALDYSENMLGIERLLLRRELCTDAGRVFLDRYGELIDISASGQLAMRHLFKEHLDRVEWDDWQFPVRLYPFLSADTRAKQRLIVIDPQIAFGRPVVRPKGITTTVIADRIDAGENVKDLAVDYGLDPADIERAVVYERAA